MEILDTDPEPQWSDTLRDPEPATEDEHRAVAEITRARDEATIAGSVAWGATHNRTRKPKKPAAAVKPPPAPKPARAAKPKPSARPAPTKPRKPAWKPGQAIDPDRPIGERIAAADHLEAKRRAILGLDRGGAAQAKIDALLAGRRALADEIRAYTSGPGAARSQLDPEHLARLREFDRRDREIVGRLESIRDAEKARIRSELGGILDLKEGDRAAWTHSDGPGFKGRTANVGARSEATAWLESKTAKGGAPIAIAWEARRGARAFASKGRSLIVVKTDESPGVMVHEMGHHLEYRLPGARKAAQDFLAHRVQDQPLESLRKTLGGAYDATEMGRDDDFAKAFGDRAAWYVGKKDSATSTEILSMGVELLYNSPVHFANSDPEFCRFILGILDGSMRTP